MKKKAEYNEGSGVIQNAHVFTGNEKLKLSFLVNNETGEPSAIVQNDSSKTSHSVDFEEVTKASEKAFERRGIMFDSRA